MYIYIYIYIYICIANSLLGDAMVCYKEFVGTSIFVFARVSSARFYYNRRRRQFVEQSWKFPRDHAIPEENINTTLNT